MTTTHDPGGLWAIDVAAVPADGLAWSQVRAGITLDELPRAFVSAADSAAKEAAVLSWRWDRDPSSGRSRNVALALLHAREIGLSFVFCDYVSIDQSLARGELLDDVIRLARLFGELPVIAAYDEPDKDARVYEFTLRRPWILSELRRICVNPTSVAHVGYQPSRTHSFENELWIVKREGFAATIYDLLHGTVEMTDVEDLALILPEFESVFAHAFRALPRNDYLMTIFLLAACSQPGQKVEKGAGRQDYGLRVNYDDTCFESSRFARYSLGPTGSTGRSYEWQHEILFDGQPVAILRTKMTSSYNRSWIDVPASGESIILDSLGVSAEARATFEDRAAARRASLFVDRSAPDPAASERLACLETGRWTEVPGPQVTSLGFVPRANRGR